MADTKSIRSTLPIAVLIAEPQPKGVDGKPDFNVEPRSAVIRPGLNNVDADLWATYSGAEQKPNLVANGSLAESSEDEPEVSYGFEPALAAASKAGAVPAGDAKPAPSTPASPAPAKPAAGK